MVYDHFWPGCYERHCQARMKNLNIFYFIYFLSQLSMQQLRPIDVLTIDTFCCYRVEQMTIFFGRRNVLGVNEI